MSAVLSISEKVKAVMPIALQTPVGGVLVDREPDTCPICHMGIDPTFITGKNSGKRFHADFEAIYLCPYLDCLEYFIAYYTNDIRGNQHIFVLKETRPKGLIAAHVPDSIANVSPGFKAIYQDAVRADKLGLSQVCGVGYRKALEFLVKDYAISLSDEEQEDHIKRSTLGTCIQKYIDDRRIKLIAERAVWLGNDETHYERRWIDKDLQDLKQLIDFLMHWIDVAIQTEATISEMVKPGK